MKKRIVSAFLGCSLLACNFVTQIVSPSTATALPTSPPVASFTPTPVPLVPAFIPPGCETTPLATLSPELSLLQPTATLQRNPEISKDTQEKILRELIDIVEEVYIYPDFNGKDWEEIKSRYAAKVQAGLDTETFYLEMQNFIDELGDEHSFYQSPTQAEASQSELRGENNYVGVGIYSLPDEERGIVTVISTFPNSPAFHAGIRSHDKIVAVDGVPLDFSIKPISRLRGPQCSAVVLTVQSPGEAPRDTIVIRAPIAGGLNIDARLVPTVDGSKIGYIFIPTFFDETIPPQIEKALNDFGPLDGLILDVRLNGGGSSGVVEPILEHFVSGTIGRFYSRTQSRSVDVDPNPIHNSLTVPIVLIVSEDTQSFGEIFAAILRDSGHAKVVGETSLGNVEVLHRFDFDDGSQAWIASETFASAFSDTDFEQTGIIPDVAAFAEWDTITFETDPSIDAALELLGHN